MRMPKHVYTLASMNSVDSSTNPLDSALGRRFFRYEVRPDAALLSAHLGVSAGDRRFTRRGCLRPRGHQASALSLLVASSMRRLPLFAGCDYQLGHSYLCPRLRRDRGAGPDRLFQRGAAQADPPAPGNLFRPTRSSSFICSSSEKPSPIRLLEPDALDEELGASAAILWDGLFSCSDASLSEWVLRLLMEHGAAEPSPAGGA